MFVLCGLVCCRYRMAYQLDRTLFDFRKLTFRLRLCLVYGMRQMGAGLCHKTFLTEVARYWGLTQLGPTRMIELVHEVQVWILEFSIE